MLPTGQSVMHPVQMPQNSYQMGLTYMAGRSSCKVASNRALGPLCRTLGPLCHDRVKAGRERAIFAVRGPTGPLYVSPRMRASGGHVART